jgi:hypothetical protein
MHSWPSVVIEVGYSESLRELREDAAWWLEHSDRQTRMAIIIKIGTYPNSMKFECWEMRAGPNRPVTRSWHGVVPTLTQFFDVEHDGTVTPAGTDMVIPYLTIFDSHHMHAADIVLSSNELSTFATFVFDGLQ